MKRNTSKVFGSGQGKLKSLFGFVSFIFTKPGIALITRIIKRKFIKDKPIDYDAWIKNKLDTDRKKKEFDTTYPLLKTKPLFTIIAADTDSEPAINTVLHQHYPDWELLMTGNTTESVTTQMRTRIIPVQGGASFATCSNTAVQEAKGDYILFLRQGMRLTPDCLFAFAKYINENPEGTIIYADEDQADEVGHFSNPYFKPDWSPDSFLSRNYIGDSFIIKTELARQLTFHEGIDGSELFDLLLRATELPHIPGHIPEILFHYRNRAQNATPVKNTLQSAMQRRRTPAIIEAIPTLPGLFHIRYEVKTIEKVSIIIPTKDQADLLKTAIDSVLSKTTYPDYEIIVLNNNSVSPQFFGLMEEYRTKHPGKFRCIDANFPFNFSRLMNLGVEESKGKYILLLNNDIEVIDAGWMTQMVGYAQQTHIGAVGVKLLYPDDTIQHAGIVAGINGDAGHVFVNMPGDTPGYHGCVQTATNYTAVTGACLMCRKDLYKKAGGMNEALPVEYNDIDLCLRFLRLGHYNVYIHVELYHHESATRGHPYRSKAAWLQHDKDFTTFKNDWQRYIDNDPFYNPNLSRKATDYRLK